MLALQRQGIDFPPDESRRGAVSGIAGIGRQRHRAGIYEGRGNVIEALFGADEGERLSARVEFDAKAARVEFGDGLTVGGQAVVIGVAMGSGAASRRFQGRDHLRRRREIRAADVKPDDILALAAQGFDARGELRKNIRW